MQSVRLIRQEIVACALLSAALDTHAQPANLTLTAVPGVKVGHHTIT